MIGLSNPWQLLWALPLAVLVLVLISLQLRAFAWLSANVAPRHLPRLSRATRAGLRLHLLLLGLAGALVVVAAAGPFRVGSGEQLVQSRTIVLVLDGSLSMGAEDAVAPDAGDDDEAISRFDLGKRFCSELVAAMPDAAFALVSFSGDAVIHSPPTRDHHALQVLLGALRYHIYSQSMGSRFSSAFDGVIHLMSGPERSGSYQVVLLSDGELSVADDYRDGLHILADKQVPVHTVGLGSRKWQQMSVYNLEDVLNGADEPREAAEYRTRRESAELDRMSDATGGAALVVEHGDWIDYLQLDLEKASSDAVAVSGRHPIDLSRYPLVGFLVLLLAEMLLLGRRASAPATSSAFLLLLIAATLSTGCGSPLLRAHLLNESGITCEGAGQHKQAATLFERSAGYGIREQVPVYNLANTSLARGDLSAAHDQYERAILLQPRLADAHYNDGITLYRWGQAELDPRGCLLERTRTLWQQAATRFGVVTELAGADSPLGRAAEENRRHVEQALAKLDQLAEQCPGSGSGGDGNPEDGPDGSGGGQEGQGAEEGRQGEGGSGSQGDDPGVGAAGAPPPLSDSEQEEITAALERARAEAASAGGYRQSRNNHLTTQGVEGSSGKKIWW